MFPPPDPGTPISTDSDRKWISLRGGVRNTDLTGCYAKRVAIDFLTLSDKNINAGNCA
jgi:hypothetical protein